MNKQFKTADFFLTGRPKSGGIQQYENQQTIQLPPIDSQKKLERELQKLQEEQEQYDMMNEMDYKILSLNSDIRKQRAEIETTKSAYKMTQIVMESQLRNLETTIKYSLQSLQDKVYREMGTSVGYNEYVEKSIGNEKKEDKVIKDFVQKLEQRVKVLEFELGIDESN